MTTYFVSRHQGARDWAQTQKIEAEFLDHLDLSRVNAGDHVMGTLPVSLAAEICKKGARYSHLDLPLSRADREVELTAEDMTQRGASLTELHVKPKRDVPYHAPDWEAIVYEQDGTNANRRRLIRAILVLILLLVAGLMVFSGEQVLDTIVEEAGFNWIYFFFLFLCGGLLCILTFRFEQNPFGVLGATVKSSPVESEIPRKYILTGYSPIPEGKEKRVKDALTLSEDPNSLKIIAEPKELYDKAGHPFIGSWQQNIRAIYPHRDAVEVIYILRPDRNDVQFESFCQFLSNCLKSHGTHGVKILQVHFPKTPDDQFEMRGRGEPSVPNYEDFEYVYEGLNMGLRLIRKTHRARPKSDRRPHLESDDVIIDITPGIKLFSAAAATVTLNSNIKYSYVNNKGQILFYDADIKIAGG